MSLKIVMHPETKEIITIDTNKEPKWMSKYLHRITGLKFENPVEEEVTEQVEQPTEEVEQPMVVLTPSDNNEMSLEEVQALYVKTTGKNLPPAQKNNKEWLLSKIKG